MSLLKISVAVLFIAYLAVRHVEIPILFALVGLTCLWVWGSAEFEKLANRAAKENRASAKVEENE